MSGGISIPAGLSSAELFSFTALEVVVRGSRDKAAAALAAGAVQPWRPPQWNRGTPTNYMYMVIVPGAYAGAVGQLTPSQPANGSSAVVQPPAAGSTLTAQPTYLVFDGVMRASHYQTARPTQYPVQNQANFTDHVILEPARLSLDIIMSDAIQSYTEGQWVGNPSKSISCFQILDTLRAARIPLTVNTRLKTYTNMVLTDVVPDETYKTLHGLRARVEFQQVFIASVTAQVQGVSARQQTTDSTQLGPTNTTPVPAGVVSQNGLPSASTGVQSSAELQRLLGDMNGAGNWSSNNTSQLPLDGVN